jgi:hypothetical protein
MSKAVVYYSLSGNTKEAALLKNYMTLVLN